ncbi:MAG: AraC family transcriptional regulator [Pseudomonadota bacterium]
MLNEPTSLANVVYQIGRTLDEEYGIDPMPIYAEIGVPPPEQAEQGARHPNSAVNEMWRLAAEATGDPAFGVKVGLRSHPGRYFVLGYAWMASATLADAMRCLIRYEEIIDSGYTEIRFEKSGGQYVVSETYPNPADHPGQLSVDSSIASLFVLMRIALGRPVVPTKLELMWSADTPLEIYAGLVDGPIVLEADRNAIHYRAEDLEERLSGNIPDVVEATTAIAERYLQSLDNSRVAHQVREILVQMLPAGSANQQSVASMLNRSSSTLQRQLSAEGTSYRDVLEQTRRTLAEAYLRDGQHTHVQVAFLVGFSDQSNFARAFRRWTGMSPGQYQKSVAESG